MDKYSYNIIFLSLEDEKGLNKSYLENYKMSLKHIMCITKTINTLLWAEHFSD